jgi:RNA 2',3'-cyclic 3'-phosphodiesterase
MSLRLFFALWPTHEQREQLANATRDALSQIGGRPVPLENHHLTLAFLGSVAEERLDELRAIATQVAAIPIAGALPIEVVLDRLEHWRKANLIAATASAPPPPAAALAATLQEALTGARFTPDLKPFRPHVTLVRKVSRASRDLCMTSTRWTFDAMTLVRSRTAPTGSLYSVLDSWALCAARSR